MTGRVKQPIWVVPLAIAGLVALFGWWGNARLRQTIEAQLKAVLTGTLDANVTALEIWTTNQAKLATSLAEEPKIRELALRVLEVFQQSGGEGKQIADLRETEELGNYLRPRLNKVGYEMAHLVSTNLVVVAGSMRGRPRPIMPVYEEHLAKFSELFASGQPVIITPFKPKRPADAGFRAGPRQTRDGKSGRRSANPPPPRERGTNEFRPGDRPPPSEFARLRRGDVTLMQVAAPLRDNDGVVRGALALIIDPDAEFTRILSVARSGESGETYAFDQHGLMISRSRFDDQLKKLGLIEDRPGASSALNLRLGDPGNELP